ncbi:MAG: YciI family protein [Candidatus Eremiobacteraeota bacterium]|nr:YciI family protein [Candidatus Eremiobacteraeota bacterium]MBV9646149.1 YciI family protein [Candidatus Eremiobacteraeota bacterium]
MKYACLVYGDGNLSDPLPESETQALHDDSIAYHEELRKSGRLLAVEALEPASTATTVRTRNGRVLVTDGPFADTKEQLGGLFIVEARDLNEAIRIASSHPATRHDAVEIRPVRELS